MRALLLVPGAGHPWVIRLRSTEPRPSLRLNAAIKPIWDHLDKGVRKIIEDEIQPALQQRLGRLGALEEVSSRIAVNDFAM